eukprot:1598064-Pyramimonas_sp.AAC.1
MPGPAAAPHGGRGVRQVAARGPPGGAQVRHHQHARGVPGHLRARVHALRHQRRQNPGDARFVGCSAVSVPWPFALGSGPRTLVHQPCSALVRSFVVRGSAVLTCGVVCCGHVAVRGETVAAKREPVGGPRLDTPGPQ